MSIKIVGTQLSSSSQLITAEAAEDSFPGFQLGFEKWLPFASKELVISDDPKDYVLYPVPIMYSDLPNRNGIGFPLAELVKWNVKRGSQAYKAWSGMPMYEEHRSDDHRTAIGIVIDVAMTQIKEFGQGKFWKVVALAALDRTKNPQLIAEVEERKINTYSMGAMVDGWTCSYCGAMPGRCSHIDPEKPVVFYELKGRLVYKMVYGVDPYELSVVRDPAYATAISDEKMIY
jgi:hypothetical protein